MPHHTLHDAELKREQETFAYTPESAENFFSDLRAAVGPSADVRQTYRRYQYVLTKFLDERTAPSRLVFAGPFAKMDYLLKEHKAKWPIVRAVNETRVRLRKCAALDDSELTTHKMADLKALCQLVALVDGVDIPADLIRLFPQEQTTGKPQRVVGECMRMIVASWDDSYIYGQIEDWPEEGGGKVSYANAWPAFSADWTYLRPMLHAGTQLNLVRPHIGEGGVLQPEIIILEPDYLVNVTAVARCFTHYADSPLVHLVHKIEPPVDSWAIILGNFAGQLLDEELSGHSCLGAEGWSGSQYNESVGRFFRHNALAMLTTPKADWNFHDEARRQAVHIHKAITETLPHDVGGFDAREGVVEPSFFSETLGLQGRMDFLQMDYRFLLEQKAGKGAYPYNGFVTPAWTPDHFVQLQLYMLVFRYNYRARFAAAGYDMNPMLLYSKYENSLVRMAMMPQGAFDAIRIRNGIAWLEMRLAQPGGFRLYDRLTPEMLNQKGVADKLWNNWQRPALQQLLDTIHQASPLEKAYFFRFMRFVSTEHLLSKLGNKTKACSGFASTWHDSLDEKRLAGNIFNGLTLVSPAAGHQGEVSRVDLKFSGDTDHDMSNFRKGDIVILYSYDKGTEPDATHTMVMRCTIAAITGDGHIALVLRHPQSDDRVFRHEEGREWAIEHDFMEASFSGLYRGLYAFLSAPQDRRDLLLLNCRPDTDPSARLRGDYGSFNELALRVKQARDFFLIIGPPGTGKTSYGLLNTLREQLLEEGSAVLLMSYTNRAVDEICSKLKEADIDFIRVGGDNTAPEEYKGYLISERVARAGSLTEVRRVLTEARVYVGTTTAVSAHLNLFQLKTFDLAIIDEASQILEPHLLGILSAENNGRPAVRKFVMIGDHKQLPAVVQQTPEDSRVDEPLLLEAGLIDCRLSLFERLLRRYRGDTRVVYMLTKQGRMHPDIAAFPNYTFYNGRLEAVPLPHQLESLARSGRGHDGLDDLLATRRVAFVSADLPENSPSDKVNMVEAEMIAATVFHIWRMEQDGFSADDTVGVIVPYRNQIAAIRKLLDGYGVAALRNITVDTVERFQGSQRRYIVYGFTIQRYYQLNFLAGNVFIDADGTVVDRKLNVAMTRAKEHLLMIGHAPLLDNNFTFHKLLEFVASRFGYFEVGKDDFVQGRFAVPDYSPQAIDPGKMDFSLSPAFAGVFAKLVAAPLEQASGTDWPRRVLGRAAAANLDAIAYGRLTESNVMPADRESDASRTLLYAFYFMRRDYCCCRSVLTACKPWLDKVLPAVGNRLSMVDIGCGPAACGVAFGELFPEALSSAAYTGIDANAEMRHLGEQVLRGMFGSSLRSVFLPAFSSIGDSYWRECSSAPSLVVFCLPFLFSKISSQAAERLAGQIIRVFRQYPTNKYVVMVLQSRNNKGLNAYSVFRSIVAPYMETVRQTDVTLPYDFNGQHRHLAFSCDVLSRG